MKTSEQNLWHSLAISVEPFAHEAIEYALIEAGALGTVTNDQRDGLSQIVGYFEAVPDRERVRTELAEALRIYSLPTSAVKEMAIKQIANRDWLAEWKKGWQPVCIGRFIIAPPWSELNEPGDNIIIRIEPGMAFGTGTHETTRLCLAAIEKHFAGSSFLDVGTGTGILAIAAAKLFPSARIEGFDNDDAAIRIARENAIINGVEKQIEFHVGSVDEFSASADLVCANLTADVILSSLESLLGLTCGKLILSGILETQLDDLLMELIRFAVSDVEISRDGEWVCCVL